ncbi:hypothetical protein PFHG_05477, partial [Plasmodium falciparum HB3]
MVFVEQQPGQTFKEAHNCAPCSQFKIDCENGKCTSGGINEKCNGKNNRSAYITASDIKNGGNSTHKLDMLVSDKSGNGFKDVLNECAGADIFKGIRKDVWTCGKVCGYVVCKSKNVNGETTSGENNDQIITIRGLVTHWVQNFLDDYKKIKHKISQCTKSENKSKCISGCDKKCKCVGQWIKLKQQEWKTLKERFNEQYKNKDSGDYPVKTILEELIPQIGAANANNDVKKVIKLSKFDNSCACSADANAQKKDSNENDAIDCMINRLQQKIGECKNKHNGQTSSLSGEKQSECKEYTPPDDEDLLLEEEENTVAQPKICPKPPDPPQEKVEEKCGKDEETRKEKEPEQPAKEESGAARPSDPAEKPAADSPLPSTPSGDSNPDQTPVLKPEEEAPAPAPAREPFDPTILQTTIPFGIALALGSIAFLFLK